VADHLTEEEQIEAIKRWWKENWLSLVLPIVLAALAYTGWNVWQDRKETSAKLASDQYQNLLNFYQAPEFSESQRGQALLLAEQIANEHSGSLYADLSLLLAARLSVEGNELDEAQQKLEAVIDSNKRESEVQIAKARMAKVLLAKGQYNEALGLVPASAADSARALYAEIRGDIYLAQEQHSAARTAYEEALTSLSPSEANHAAIIQFKLQGVAQEDVQEENTIIDAGTETDASVQE
jgi:predicted negative regulator of RcsB-dependent stress response